MSDNQDVPDWVRSIPDSWRLFPVGKLFDERKEYVSDTEFPALSVTKRGVIPQLSDVAKTQNGDSRKLVRSGDFVINSRSDRKGSSGISEQDGSVSVVYTVLRPREELDLNFVHHLLRSSAFQEEFYRWGSGIVADLWSTRYSAMKKIMLPTPPLDEQRAIADYLDRETQKIDELITEQRGLIETLKERRRSLIDLGAEKASAEQIRLRYLFTPSEVRDCHDERVLSVYRDFGVIPKGSREGNHNVTPEDVSRYLLVRPGDLVVNRMKAWQGSLGVSQYRGIVSGDYEVLRPATDRLLPEFAHLYLRSARMVGRYVVRSTGIRPSQWRLYWKQMADIEIPVPGVQEQQKIVSFVSEQTSRIDELIAESEDLISLSQERRAALITTAVTGQIDVGEAS